MSNLIDLNKLFTNDEFNSLYSFLDDSIIDIEETLEDEEILRNYKSAQSIIQLSQLVNFEEFEDDAIISIDIIVGDTLEDAVEKAKNLTDEEKKEKIENSFTKKQYATLVEDANNLIDEIESKKEELKVIKNIFRKLTPIYDLFQTEKW
jgi:predicted RNase H-like nuclease (RuvC/YqgF family)